MIDAAAIPSTVVLEALSEAAAIMGCVLNVEAVNLRSDPSGTTLGGNRWLGLNTLVHSPTEGGE